MNLHAQLIDGAELTLKKTFTGESLVTDREFTVDKKLNSLKIDITGTAKSGKIIIHMNHPKVGSKFFMIDVTSNMEFHQIINLKKMPEYVGKWTIFITSDKADGFYDFYMGTK
jgi:hypothetical protein